ncbi:MAG: glycosyltransferase family 4 protein [Pseudomonadota bacterium]
MRIAFLIKKFEAPSSRYRVLQYIPYLQEMGHVCTVLRIPPRFHTRFFAFRKMSGFDLVVLQKKLLGPLEFRLLCCYSKSLIYDFDDAVMYRDSRHANSYSWQRRRRFIRTVNNADWVIAGNRYLREEVPHSRVTIIPTPIDMERYRAKVYRDEEKTVTLGWIGSRSTLAYLADLKGVLEKIGRSFDNVQLQIVCDNFFDCQHLKVIKKPWRYEEEIEDLHSFDIGLMPLSDDPWSRGKCAFKLLQCMAVGVPVVASPVGMNCEIVHHQKNGFLAHNEDEWFRCLTLLIQQADLRKRIGENGRNFVEREYSLSRHSQKMGDLFSNYGR